MIMLSRLPPRTLKTQGIQKSRSKDTFTSTDLAAYVKRSCAHLNRAITWVARPPFARGVVWQQVSQHLALAAPFNFCTPRVPNVEKK